MHRVRSVFTGVAGSPWITNTYFEGETHTAAAAVTAMRGFWDDSKALIGTAVTVRVENEVASVVAATGEIEGYTAVAVPAPVVGTGATDLLPTMTQAFVRLSTAGVVQSRRVQGRIWVPGVTELHNTSTGQPSAVVLSTLTTAVNTLLSAPGMAQVQIWSRPVEAAGIIIRPGTAHNVTGGIPRSIWGVLRSRRD